MYEFVIFLIIITILILGYLFFVPPFKENYQQDADRHLIPSIKDTSALLAPNIPMDPQKVYRIGGKYCNELLKSYRYIAPMKGKYSFPIAKLLYDGVWNNQSQLVSKDGETIEANFWNLICNIFPTNGSYQTNKFFHVPKYVLPQNCYIIDKSIFYGDRNIIPQYTKNDICKGKDIVYQDMGINAKYKKECGR